MTIASGVLTLLKSISFFHSYLSLIIPARFKKESPNFHKKAKPWRILAAVVKERGWGQGGHNLPPSVPLSPFVSRLPPFSERDETLILHDSMTQSTHLYMCYAISFMTYDVSDLERFRVWPEVMPFFFFLSRLRIFDFWIFSNIKYCFKLRRTLNRRLWVRFFDWMISNNK